MFWHTDKRLTLTAAGDAAIERKGQIYLGWSGTYSHSFSAGKVVSFLTVKYVFNFTTLTKGHTYCT